MKVIHENPYRLLGVYANSPAKERVANMNRLKQYMQVGKQMSFPLDLPGIMGDAARTDESIAEAKLNNDIRISIIGLGYVGYPLYKLFSTRFDCIGLDIDNKKVQELLIVEDKHSPTNVVQLTSSYSDISDCDVHIVAVPTPINNDNKPDLSLLKNACTDLARVIKKGSVVVFESTVAPGTTEEICIPLLESISNMRVNVDFVVGYSPERINIGDQLHSISNTSKIVSASCDTALKQVAELYMSVITAPIVFASSIKVAEASKMYENVQRDVLIALANEYAEYCRAEGISALEVTECASSKWNFANVSAGLVGGHCISVDPYYLMSRAKSRDISMPLIATARKTNERKPLRVAERIIDLVVNKGLPLDKTKVLILGFSYKPNIADVRNTKVADIIYKLREYLGQIDCVDPLTDGEIVAEEYGILLKNISEVDMADYDIIVLGVSHAIFKPLIDKLPIITLNSLL